MSDSQRTSRYSRQERFAPLGKEGQQRLGASTVLVVGCGALGTVSSNTLVRAGVGRVKIVDRDFVDLSNLQRQVLFDEQDVASGLPKAVAAAQKLRQINSEVVVEPHVADLTHENIRALADDADIIVDGTDNFETRLLLNDYAVCEQRPWVYGGCVGAEGQVLAFLPGETGCLTGLIPEAPEPGAVANCDSAGVLGPAVNMVASLQATEAIKILTGATSAVCRELTVFDLWRNRWRCIDVSALHPTGGCPTCDDRVFPWLEGTHGSEVAVLCGRNAVQLKPSTATKVDLDRLAKRLSEQGETTLNPFLTRVCVEGMQITVFADGRAIVVGTDDPAAARSAYARIVGS